MRPRDYSPQRGMAKGGKGLVKVLGDGEISTAITVKANKFSASP